ncbi:hypothetical protein LXA43DRAFT_1130777 [Ganoderma leucocontextum]|nr:hypothetical protein LXA43DRAFT_1130777 [Ganoderma leucocontextum]
MHVTTPPRASVGEARVLFYCTLANLSNMIRSAGNASVGYNFTDATVRQSGTNGVTLIFNPRRIDPTHAAWNTSRKPLVAHRGTPSGVCFFTINLHLTAKLAGTSTQGNPRPPIDAMVDQQTSQVKVVAEAD